MASIFLLSKRISPVERRETRRRYESIRFYDCISSIASLKLIPLVLASFAVKGLYGAALAPHGSTAFHIPGLNSSSSSHPMGRDKQPTSARSSPPPRPQSAQASSPTPSSRNSRASSRSPPASPRTRSPPLSVDDDGNGNVTSDCEQPRRGTSEPPSSPGTSIQKEQHLEGKDFEKETQPEIKDEDYRRQKRTLSEENSESEDETGTKKKKDDEKTLWRPY